MAETGTTSVIFRYYLCTKNGDDFGGNLKEGSLLGYVDFQRLKLVRRITDPREPFRYSLVYSILTE
jgi:hypothetical protein